MPKPAELWTRAAAIQRMQQNTVVQEALQLEPRLQAVFDAALFQENVPGYHRIERWYELKYRMQQLIGLEAEHLELRTPGERAVRHFSEVGKTIDDLLPPDDVDLYPEGKPDNE